MQSFAWLRDLSDQLAQERQQQRDQRARLARQQLFLVPPRLEVLEPRALLAADFGYAPAPYPTLLSENGARSRSKRLAAAGQRKVVFNVSDGGLSAEVSMTVNVT